MATISRSEQSRVLPHRSTQFRYATVYVVITFAVLLFLNIYCSETSQTLFSRSKEAAMTERCCMASSELGELEVFSDTTVSAAISKLNTLRFSRLVVTDASGFVLYDTAAADNLQEHYALFPEIMEALGGVNSFSWKYHDGVMRSMAASPVFTAGSLSGCVYMMEHDLSQGALLKSLQNSIFWITLLLEIVVVLFSCVFHFTFTHRLRKIFASMRIIREGDYSHKVKMGGSDELATLGEEFNVLTERLQTSENKRRQFVSDASHELKTPLASIKLLSDSILQNEMDMDTVKEFVEDIGNEAERLNRMSQKLLSLSKIESQLDPDMEIIPMAPTVRRVVKMLSAISEKNRTTIELELDDRCPILITEDDLYQIVYNLVENGIKYNTPGGKLRIVLERDRENAVLRVADTGMGIPEEAISHIFERFYRVDKARSRKSGGSGLGLAIVNNLVTHNGGTIEVESTLGEGTQFTVTFPLFDTEEAL